MYKEIPCSQFKHDYKLMKKQGKDLTKLKTVIDTLSNGQKLDATYKDYSLTGNWKGFRECHIEPDWLLIYRITNFNLYLARTGSHSELLEYFIPSISDLNKKLYEILNNY